MSARHIIYGVSSEPQCFRELGLQCWFQPKMRRASHSEIKSESDCWTLKPLLANSFVWRLQEQGCRSQYLSLCLLYVGLDRVFEPNSASYPCAAPRSQSRVHQSLNSLPAGASNSDNFPSWRKCGVRSRAAHDLCPTTSY